MTATRSRSDRNRIADTARATLRAMPGLGPTFHLQRLEIGDDGVVLLDGEVPSVAAKKTALLRIAAIEGVSGIVDRLHVMPAVPMSDKQIRVRVLDALVIEPSFEGIEIYERSGDVVQLIRGAPVRVRGTIDAEVVDGVIVLNGRVPSLASKRLAGVICWWVPGVRDVVNGLIVEPSEEDGPPRVAEAVRAVLERDPFVESARIRVGVRNTVVRLTGTVSTAVAAAAAERDAWMVFGVDAVINRLEVHP